MRSMGLVQKDDVMQRTLKASTHWLSHNKHFGSTWILHRRRQPPPQPPRLRHDDGIVRGRACADLSQQGRKGLGVRGVLADRTLLYGQCKTEVDESCLLLDRRRCRLSRGGDDGRVAGCASAYLAQRG